MNTDIEALTKAIIEAIKGELYTRDNGEDYAPDIEGWDEAAKAVSRVIERGVV